jgi:hypothetical protein
MPEPAFAGAEFFAPVDIMQHGVREPRVLYEDAFLDGCKRYRASRRASLVRPELTTRSPGRKLAKCTRGNLYS